MPEFVIKLPEIFSDQSFDEIVPAVESFVARNDPAETPLVFDCRKTEYQTILATLMLERMCGRIAAQGKAPKFRHKIDPSKINIGRALLRLSRS